MPRSRVLFHALPQRGLQDADLVGVILEGAPAPDGAEEQRPPDPEEPGGHGEPLDPGLYRRLHDARALLADEAAPGVVVLDGVAYLPLWMDRPERRMATRLRDAAAELLRRVAPGRSVALLPPPGVAGDDEGVAAVLEGALLGTYAYSPGGAAPEEVTRVGVAGVEPGRLERLAARAGAFAGATMLARDLTNAPGGSLTPRRFVEVARERARDAGVAVNVIEGEALAAERAAGLLAVSRGSHEPARLLELAYQPAGAALHVAIVGKGITFDSGGLQLKSAEGMRTMKADMAGAAAVLAAVVHLGQLGSQVAVSATIPLADNMPGPDATRPGDLVHYPNGEVVEVLSTDAEGRLVLADGLLREAARQPDVLLDVATLTGACEVALGPDIGGLWSSDDRLADLLLGSAERCGEPLWRLPLVESYERLLSSDLVGTKNIGPRAGGAITAALFLRRFVPAGLPWAHVDMSAPARSDDVRGALCKGATGFGARLLLQALLEAETSWKPADG